MRVLLLSYEKSPKLLLRMLVLRNHIIFFCNSNGSLVVTLSRTKECRNFSFAQVAGDAMTRLLGSPGLGRRNERVEYGALEYLRILLEERRYLGINGRRA